MNMISFFHTAKWWPYIYNIKSQFDPYGNKFTSFTLNGWSVWNTFEYQTFKNTVKVAETQSLVETQTKNLNKIEPNLIQREALKSLTSLEKNAKDKALIISTGTGKTILSALDVRNYDPKKFLFVVHNEGILNEAINESKKYILNQITQISIIDWLLKIKILMLNIYLLLKPYL